MNKVNRSKIDIQILIFQGGGYDGCFWEWNALFFDRKTKALLADQPAISGRAGKHILSVAEREGYKSVLAFVQKEAYRSDSVFVVNSQKTWSEFIEEFNAGFVRSVAKHCQYDLPCNECGHWKDTDEIFHCSYKGDGGIGIQFTDLHCRECAEELHDKYCSEEIWPYLYLKEKIESIKRCRDECGSDLSIFAARQNVAPVRYDMYYEGSLELY